MKKNIYKLIKIGVFCIAFATVCVNLGVFIKSPLITSAGISEISIVSIFIMIGTGLGFLLFAPNIALFIKKAIYNTVKARSSRAEPQRLTAAPNWVDRYKVAVEEQIANPSGGANTVLADLNNHTEGWRYYRQIEDTNKSIQNSLASKIEKERAAHLKVLADKVAEHLRSLESINQLQTLTCTGEIGTDAALKCQEKLEQVSSAMNELLDRQTNNASSNIDSIRVSRSI